jgi:UDP-N-acetylglucosamine transferase subunit ALG13
VFITVGNATQGFERLLSQVDELVEHEPTLQMFVQAGSCNGYTPKRAAFARTLPMQEFERRMREADVVVMHAGAGSILQAFSCGKVPVVVPRLARSAEAVDDHQSAFLRRLEGGGRVIAVWDVVDLGRAIWQAYSSRSALKAMAQPSLVAHLAAEIRNACSRTVVM